MWWKIYETLELHGGAITYISDDCEDMLEIRYPDGMMIDVGKMECDGIYYITVVPSDDETGWCHLLLELPVKHKSDLFDSIQNVIDRFRTQN